MRINVLVNAPWGPTAYSNMARVYGPRIAALGHAVSMTAMWGLDGGPIVYNGIPVFPRHVDKLARDVAGAHAYAWKSDVFMSWCDAFVVEPKTLGAMPWAAWCPVDADPVSPHLVPLLQQAHWPLVYSRWGTERAREGGVEHARYMPIGIDTTVFQPQDRAEARRKLELPADAYIVGMVAANIKGDRKAYPQQLRAFAEFKRKHPEAMLVIHALKDHAHGGVDLQAACDSLGLVTGRDVWFCHQYAYNTGQLNDAYLATFYAAIDVLLSVTQAEGFGIPIVEAAACGRPAIVGQWSAMRDLNFSRLGVDEADTVRIFNRFDTWWWLPRPEAITEQLERARRGAHPDAETLRSCALRYDVDRVMRLYWAPLLEEMEGEVCA